MWLGRAATAMRPSGTACPSQSLSACESTSSGAHGRRRRGRVGWPGATGRAPHAASDSTYTGGCWGCSATPTSASATWPRRWRTSSRSAAGLPRGPCPPRRAGRRRTSIPRRRTAGPTPAGRARSGNDGPVARTRGRGGQLGQDRGPRSGPSRRRPARRCRCRWELRLPRRRRPGALAAQQEGVAEQVPALLGARRRHRSEVGEDLLVTERDGRRRGCRHEQARADRFRASAQPQQDGLLGAVPDDDGLLCGDGGVAAGAVDHRPRTHRHTRARRRPSTMTRVAETSASLSHRFILSSRPFAGVPAGRPPPASRAAPRATGPGRLAPRHSAHDHPVDADRTARPR